MRHWPRGGAGSPKSRDGGGRTLVQRHRRPRRREESELRNGPFPSRGGKDSYKWSNVLSKRCRDPREGPSNLARVPTTSRGFWRSRETLGDDPVPHKVPRFLTRYPGSSQVTLVPCEDPKDPKGLEGFGQFADVGVRYGFTATINLGMAELGNYQQFS